MSPFAPSSSSGSSSVEYEVFISFRGSDTRYAFTSHLHAALIHRKIVTFIDYEIPSGDGISSALLDAIKKSKAAVVIFSKHYASSTWCLDELVEILKWNKIVIPVFYHVDPNDVEEQTGSYAESFVVHETNGIPVETLQNWKAALKKASYLKGYDTAVFRDEASLTKRIVDDIWKELRTTYKIDNKNLVGIEPKVDKIESLLNMGSGDVCVVGIWGIGGIGKTTLADAVFNKIRTQFEGSCFLRNIREESEKDNERLRRRLYFDISGEESGNMVDDVKLTILLSRKKVLIVFDDVTGEEQIKNIVQGVNRCNRESRFIITSRNKQVFRNCHCKEENVYKVNGLRRRYARQLFSRFAFKQEHPQEDYTKLSRKIVDYAKGSPLALKVLGSYLFGKSKLIWESAIEKLKRAPYQKIQGVLKISFDGLDDAQKNVFLDVACFLKGNLKKNIVNLYDGSFEFTLDALIDRCLVSVDSVGCITMHDLLEEMGRQIVQEESTGNPGERSRLWHPDDICQVLEGNEGTKAIKCISFDMSQTNAIRLNKNSFNKMSELWYLGIYNSKLSCSKGFQCVSPKLRVLRWNGYPMKSLQSSFSLKNLVILEMRSSKIEQLWDGAQCLPNLKEMDLGLSQNLTAIPDLSLVPKLEQINLTGCRNLRSLPPCDHLKSLEYLNLCGCKKLKAIPELPCSLRQLALQDLRRLAPHDTRITHLPSSFSNLSQRLSLKFQRSFRYFYDREELSKLKPIQILHVTFPMYAVDSICSNLLGLSNITKLDISWCCTVEALDTVCQISSLKELRLCGNDFDELPEHIKRLSKLQTLNLFACPKLQFLPELPRSLEYLTVEGCSSLKALPDSLPILLATTKRVCFSECYMLDKDAFLTIIQDALLEIQRRFRERPAQAIEETEDGHAFSDLSCIVYPGCEIPEIFEFQHLGSMISTELSHDMIGGKIVGFAFFVAYKQVGQWPLVEFLRIKFHCKITFENGECFPLQGELVGPRCPTNDSEVAVGYIQTYKFPSQYESILLELKFPKGDRSIYGVEELAYMECIDDLIYEVEKCGFHLFSSPVSKRKQKRTSSSSSRVTIRKKPKET